MTGDVVSNIRFIDEAVDGFMKSIGCRAATITVMRGESVLCCRGYGWMDEERRVPTRPNTLMRIASCSKPITAASVKRLIREGIVRNDQLVFPYLNLKPKSNSRIDDRLNQITVQHLLEHRGGFDRREAFDPMFRTAQVENDLGLSTSATPHDVIRYMLDKPLQFDPGSRRAYSNFGYAILGRVIEKATGGSYFEYINNNICKPIGIGDLCLSRSRASDRPDAEVWYPVAEDAFSMEVTDAHGGLTTSTESLCKFMAAYWLTGEPRLKDQTGSAVFFGSLPGTTAMMLQRPDGVNCAVLLNGRRNRTFNDDNQRLKEEVEAAITRFLEQ